MAATFIKNKNIAAPVINDLLVGMHLFHYPRIGNPKIENRVNKRELERLIKDCYGVAYNENVHEVYTTLLSRFDENRLQTKPLLTKEKVKYIQTHDFLSHFTKSNIELIFNTIDDALEENKLHLENGERLELYFRMLKFLREDLLILLKENALDVQDFQKRFITLYITEENDIYDLIERTAFLERTFDYLDNDKFNYYTEKDVGTTEAEHLIKIIDIFEQYRDEKILSEKECSSLIQDLIADYEYQSIQMENANNLFLRREGRKYTRNLWGFLLFGAGLITACLYYI